MYKPINISDLRQLTKDLPVDLFVKLDGEKYFQVFSRSTGLDYQRLGSYRKKGVTQLFYKEEDEAVINQYRKERRMDLLLQSPSVLPEQKTGILLNWTEQTVSEVFTAVPAELSAESVEYSKGLVTNLVDLMTKQPQSLAALLRMVSQGEYLYYHAVSVSAFSGLVARASGKYSDEDAKVIAWGGFLHDIGMSRMTDEWTCDPLGERDSQYLEHIEAHCRLGVEALKEFKVLPSEVNYIVYQHHEAPNGSGLPNRLKGSSIHGPAMLVAAVDNWSALISRHPHRAPLTPPQAIKKMREPEMVENFDPEVLDWLQKALFPGASPKK